MPYSPDDMVWLLALWLGAAKAGGEYTTWRNIVGRYPGKSDLAWLWGLVEQAVDEGYLALVHDKIGRPDPDARVTWDWWQLTDTGRALAESKATPR